MQDEIMNTTTSEEEARKKKGTMSVIFDTVKENGLLIGGATLLVAGGFGIKRLIGGKKTESVPVLDCPSDLGVTEEPVETPTEAEKAE